MVSELQAVEFSKVQLPPKIAGDHEIEQNKGVVFPGLSMELVKDRQAGSFNVAANATTNGRLCKTKEILFVEVMDSKNEFTFKFSEHKSDQAKCSTQFCNKMGLIDLIWCACKQVAYCSEKCQANDSNHAASCPELIKLQYDPNNIDFTVA